MCASAHCAYSPLFGKGNKFYKAILSVICLAISVRKSLGMSLRVAFAADVAVLDGMSDVC